MIRNLIMGIIVTTLQSIEHFAAVTFIIMLLITGDIKSFDWYSFSLFSIVGGLAWAGVNILFTVMNYRKAVKDYKLDMEEIEDESLRLFFNSTLSNTQDAINSVEGLQNRFLVDIDLSDKGHPKSLYVIDQQTNVRHFVDNFDYNKISNKGDENSRKNYSDFIVNKTVEFCHLIQKGEAANANS